MSCIISLCIVQGEEPPTVAGLLHRLGLVKYAIIFQAEEVSFLSQVYQTFQKGILLWVCFPYVGPYYWSFDFSFLRQRKRMLNISNVEFQ